MLAIQGCWGTLSVVLKEEDKLAMGPAEGRGRERAMLTEALEALVFQTPTALGPAHQTRKVWRSRHGTFRLLPRLGLALKKS